MGGGGGGGSTTVQPRTPSQEKKTLGNWDLFQQQELNNYYNNNPLVGNAANTAAANSANVGQLITPLQQTQAQIPGVYNSAMLLPANVADLSSTNLNNVYEPVIANRGYDPQTAAIASQSARVAAEAAGTLHTPGGAANELLTRQEVQDARLANYTNMFNSAAGTELGAVQSGASLFNQGALLQNAESQNIQGLQSGAINQNLGVSNAAVNQFATTTNPVMAYLGNLFQGNLQGSIAQAQINEQQNMANSNKSSGIAGAAGSLIGGVVKGVAAGI